MDSNQRRSKNRFRPGKLLLVLWLAGTTLVIGILMARHSVPFRMPEGLEAFSKKTIDSLPDLADADYLAVHVLDVRCSCSRFVLQRLNTLVHENLKEKVKHVVVLLKATPDDQDAATKPLLDALREAGVNTQNLTLEQAKSVFQIESVPWLIVLSKESAPNKKGIFNINYMGGYSDRSIASASDVQLTPIIRKVTANENNIKALPSFGCVTSKQIRQQLLYNL
jgi:hypothetical protein